MPDRVEVFQVPLGPSGLVGSNPDRRGGLRNVLRLSTATISGMTMLSAPRNEFSLEFRVDMESPPTITDTCSRRARLRTASTPIDTSRACVR